MALFRITLESEIHFVLFHPVHSPNNQLAIVDFYDRFETLGFLHISPADDDAVIS